MNEDWRQRAEATEAALAEAQGNAKYWLSEHNKMAGVVSDYVTRAKAAEARAHELSVKYVCALRRAREMGEALQNILIEAEDATVCEADPWIVAIQKIARAALASQEPDEAQHALMLRETKKAAREMGEALKDTVFCSEALLAQLRSWGHDPSCNADGIIDRARAALASTQPDHE